VFHQVTAVETGKERTTMVYSFHPRNVLALEACAHLSQIYVFLDPDHVVVPEWARFRCWKAARRIEMFVERWGDNGGTGTGAGTGTGTDTDIGTSTGISTGISSCSTTGSVGCERRGSHTPTSVTTNGAGATHEVFSPSVPSVVLPASIPVVTATGGAAKVEAYTVLSSPAFWQAVDSSYEKLRGVVYSLPYVADIEGIAHRLRDAIEPLKAALTTGTGVRSTDIDGSEATNPLQKIHDECDSNDNDSSGMLHKARSGLPNLRAAVSEIESCIADIGGLHDQIETVYF
jgi:hypothetical protein